MSASDLALVPRRAGRSYGATRLVRLGDVLPSGGIRLDALARYLQDVAADDAREAGVADHMAWLVRKTIVAVRRRPALEERLDLVTWASGTGARWAERRTTMSIEGTPVVEAVSLWVCVNLATMKPTRLPEHFWTMYGEAAADRVVSARLNLPELPVDPSPGHRPWPLRVSDLDVLGHVNNAAAWAAVDDELDRSGMADDAFCAELEYRGPIDPSDAPTLASQVTDGSLYVWLSAQGTVAASAAVRPTKAEALLAAG